jgi:hypothetical protein
MRGRALYVHHPQRGGRLLVLARLPRSPDLRGDPDWARLGVALIVVWSPSIIIAVAALGSIDLSSIITPARYENKLACEREVKAAVFTMTRLYPTLQIKFAACVSAAP